MKGAAFRNASRGPFNVHAETVLKGNTYEIVRNEKKSTLKNIQIKFCVSDLFFKEPKGMKEVYSNMYGQMLSISQTESNTYTLVTPDKNSVYEYKNGKVVWVTTDTPLGPIVLELM